MARPAATSDLTNSGVISAGMRWGKRRKMLGVYSLSGVDWIGLAGVLFVEMIADDVVLHVGDLVARRMFSRMAMNSISGVMMPWRA